MLEMAAQDAQVHRPTTVGDAVVLRRARPTRMREAKLRDVAFSLELEPHACADPIGHCVCELELEALAGLARRHARSPVVAFAEEQRVRGAELGPTLRGQRPPFVE